MSCWMPNESELIPITSFNLLGWKKRKYLWMLKGFFCMLLQSNVKWTANTTQPASSTKVYTAYAPSPPIPLAGKVLKGHACAKRSKTRVCCYSVGARCLMCWGVIGPFVTDCAIPMDSLFLVKDFFFFFFFFVPSWALSANIVFV